MNKLAGLSKFTLLLFFLSCCQLASAKTIIYHDVNASQWQLTLNLFDTNKSKATSLDSMTIQIGDKTLSPLTGIKKPFATKKAHYFFLIDTSLTMRDKPITTAVALVKKIIATLPKTATVSIAGFDKQLRLIIDNQVVSQLDLSVLNQLKASGKVTEMYRLIQSAQKKLVQSKAPRPVLLLFSDGRAEDTGYSANDVLRYAKQHQILIHSFGFNYSVKLQSIRRLAEDTGGQFVEIKNTESLGQAQLLRLVNSVQNGGEATFDIAGLSDVYGSKQTIRVHYQFKGDTAQTRTLTLTFPARAWYNQVRFGLQQKWWLAIAVAFIVVLWLLAKLRTYLHVRALAIPRCDTCHKPIEKHWQKCDHCGTPLNTNSHLAQLVAVNQSPTQTWPISKARTTIGRMDDNDIVFDSDTVGRWHCNIQLKDHKFYIQDLGSTNETLLNGANINTAELQDGDMIELGELSLRFEISTIYQPGNVDTIVVKRTEGKQ